jgi:Ca2+-transporting ATPase
MATPIVVNENGLRALPVSEVYRVLETRIEGLKGLEAEAQLKLYGHNALRKMEKKNLSPLAANFTHLMAVLLWVGGLMAFLAAPHISRTDYSNFHTTTRKAF